MTVRTTLAVALMIGCSSPDAEPQVTQTAPAEPVVQIDQDELTDWIEGLDGFWFGQADPTPMGAMEFALDWAWDEDDMHAHTDNGYGFWLDFRFVESEDGWVMEQRGGLPGGFESSNVLIPTALDKKTLTLVHDTDPDYLSMDMKLKGDGLVMDVTVKSDRHCVIDLDRQ